MKMAWAALAIAGVLIAVGVSYAASRLASPDVGLSSEPITAGSKLAPARTVEARPPAAKEKPKKKKPRKRPSRPTTTTPAAPPTGTTDSTPPRRRATDRRHGGDDDNSGAGATTAAARRLEGPGTGPRARRGRLTEAVTAAPACLVSLGEPHRRRRHEGLRRRCHRGARKAARSAARRRTGTRSTGMTRTRVQARRWCATWAPRPVVADALDPDAVARAVAEAEPEVIVHQLTALSGSLDLRHFDRAFALDQPAAHRGHRPPARRRARASGVRAVRRPELRRLAVRPRRAGRSRPRTTRSTRRRRRRCARRSPRSATWRRR